MDIPQYTEKDFHEIECQQQPDEFPCICEQVKERFYAQFEDTQENIATGN